MRWPRAPTDAAQARALSLLPSAVVADAPRDLDGACVRVLQALGDSNASERLLPGVLDNSAVVSCGWRDDVAGVMTWQVFAAAMRALGGTVRVVYKACVHPLDGPPKKRPRAGGQCTNSEKIEKKTGAETDGASVKKRRKTVKKAEKVEKVESKFFVEKNEKNARNLRKKRKKKKIENLKFFDKFF